MDQFECESTEGENLGFVDAFNSPLILVWWGIAARANRQERSKTPPRGSSSFVGHQDLVRYFRCKFMHAAVSNHFS